MAIERIVSERGCGLPHAGGCYAESIGTRAGILPDIVVFEDSIPYLEPPHRGWVYFDLDGAIQGSGARRAGASAERLEDTKLGHLLAGPLQAAFGQSVVVRSGHAVDCVDTIAHILDRAGIEPQVMLDQPGMIKQLLRDHLPDLIGHIDFP
jgi:hypothetical protein